MAITAEAVRALREKTGIGMMECKEALSQANGDEAKAIDILRKRGLETYQKKTSRVMSDGRVGTYIHHNHKLGVLVELSCETDFVAKTDVFQELLKDIAMHVAAKAPISIARTDVPAALVDKEREIYRAQVTNKPANIIEKIVEGKLGKFYEEKCLLEQPFAKNPDIKVEDIIKAAVQKLGENIQIKRFARFEVGEGA
jgi:elongation factor Ts